MFYKNLDTIVPPFLKDPKRICMHTTSCVKLNCHRLFNLSKQIINLNYIIQGHTRSADYLLQSQYEKQQKNLNLYSNNFPIE